MEVPCYHIYEYYNWKWNQNKQLGYNMLRKGYYQWASTSLPEPHNNLYEVYIYVD